MTNDALQIHAVKNGSKIYAVGGGADAVSDHKARPPVTDKAATAKDATVNIKGLRKVVVFV